MRNLLLLFIATVLMLLACKSRSKQIQKQQNFVDVVEVSADSAAAVAASSAPEPSSAFARATVKFTPPEVVDDAEVVNDNESSREFLGDKANLKQKRIIKNGNISIETSNLSESKKIIDNLLKKYNAYYESEGLENNDQRIVYNLRIRIPISNFDMLITSIENGKVEVKSKSIEVQDVTEEYVDIETRLANKRAYLKRYKELLSKAQTVKDIIAIEDNIRLLQEEIESKEGRLNYLNDQVSYSTLELELYKEKEFIYKPQHQDNFLERIKKSLGKGWGAIVDSILLIISGWPIYVIVVSAFLIIKRIIKKGHSRNKSVN